MTYASANPLPILLLSRPGKWRRRNRHGKRDSDKQHPGTLITEFQKTLREIGAYIGKIDGWFYDKLEQKLGRKPLPEIGRQEKYLVSVTRHKIIAYLDVFHNLPNVNDNISDTYCQVL